MRDARYVGSWEAREGTGDGTQGWVAVEHIRRVNFGTFGLVVGMVVGLHWCRECGDLRVRPFRLVTDCFFRLVRESNLEFDFDPAPTRHRKGLLSFNYHIVMASAMMQTRKSHQTHAKMLDPAEAMELTQGLHLPSF